jgi:hypothetical protein
VHDPSPTRWHDAAAIAGLLLSAVLLSSPITLGGGWASWLDNPAHVAEIQSLARGESWCTEAFCGFPVHLLHAPLPYGFLARAVAAGVPIGFAYGAALFAGFVATPLAVYAVGRRHVGPEAAALPAWLLLVHPNALADFGSALGGMWTFHLACGALVLLIDRVARAGPRRPRDIAWIAALLGVIGNLHWMVISAAVLLALAALALRPAIHRDGPSTLGSDILAALLGALLAAPHWVPTLLGRAVISYRQQSLGQLELLVRLALPTDANALWRGTGLVSAAGAYVDALPSLALVGLGIAGAWHGREDRTVALAVRWAAALFLLLLVVLPTERVSVLGPLSWRFVWFVQVGLAIAATRAPALPGSLVRGLAPVFVLSTLWWCRPLSAETPSAEGLKDVERLWQWLRDHRAEITGRVYLQSTMGTPPEGPLWRSQVLARTAGETGVETLGTWYGITNFPTGTWTPGEFGRLFRVPIGPEHMDAILARMKRTNCSHLVLSNPQLSDVIDEAEGLTEVARIGRFVVFDRQEIEGFATVIGPGTATVTARRPGAMTVEVAIASPRRVVVRESWHPFWRVDGGASLTAAPDGLMLVDAPRSGTFHLTYQPPFAAASLLGN